MTDENKKNEAVESQPAVTPSVEAEQAETPTPQSTASDVNSDSNIPAPVSAEPTSEANSDSAQKGTGLSEDHVREALKEVIDPELFVNIVDLGLIYTVDVKSREDGQYDVDIEMTMTSPMCPAGPQLVGNSRQVVEALPEVEEVDVKVVMDPPWTQDMMSEDAKDQLNIF